MSSILGRPSECDPDSLCLLLNWLQSYCNNNGLSSKPWFIKLTIVNVIIWAQAISLIRVSYGPVNQDLNPWTDVGLLTTVRLKLRFYGIYEHKHPGLILPCFLVQPSQECRLGYQLGFFRRQEGKNEANDTNICQSKNFEWMSES